jgi:ankyrin repeat protein
MIYACYYGDIEILKALIALEVDPNGKDYDARSPLHLAASQGKLDAVKLLVLNGANVNLLDSRGNIPL